MQFSNFDPIPGEMIHWTIRKLFYFMTPIDFLVFYPLPRPKTDFWPFLLMWYKFRHVLVVQISCALELKPHLHNDDDP